ncbi:MAG TPA: hypothetical protein VKG92_00105, partial [Flavobacteriales bacterium]|nr:hypothetical protein [Flavobacteriales bacterium]
MRNTSTFLPAAAALAVIILLGPGCKMGRYKEDAAMKAATIERMRADSATCSTDLRSMRAEYLGLQGDADMTKAQLE